MRTQLLLAATTVMLLQPAWAAEQASVRADEWSQARQTAVGDTHVFRQLPTSTGKVDQVRMKRIDIYAPDARILVPDGDGFVEVPRSDWLHFVTDHGGDVTAPRLGLSFAPDGRTAGGVLIGEGGRTYVIASKSADNDLQLKLSSANEDAEGHPIGFTCLNDLSPEIRQASIESNNSTTTFATKQSASIAAASRSAVVAVDTDNEFMQLKFSDNTTNATNYLAQLFTAMNVIYERDLDLTLLQGLVLLRTSGTADPYSQNAINGQLTEFGNVWVATQNSTNRAFAMLLSGKSSSPNSASGLAWILSGSNYCTSRGANGGHYSVTQVFRFAGSNATHDLPIIAHELGHNFGAHHSHCSNSTTGVGPTAVNTIDTCFNQDSGCFSGTPVCPVPITVNGVANVRGTLMSYCNPFLSGLAGCGDSNVFATAHRTLINPRVANNVTVGCFSNSGAVNQAPTLNAIANPSTVPPNSGQRTINLSGISAGPGETQTLTVTAISNNTLVIPNPSVSYTSPNATGSISYTPAPGQQGTALITVTVTDNGGTANGGVNSVQRTFTQVVSNAVIFANGFE